jgi:hypothetical protein
MGVQHSCLVQSPGNRPIYPDLPSSSGASTSARTRSNSWSADVATADLIGELARRTSERAEELSSDARKLRTLELYVRGLESKLVAVSLVIPLDLTLDSSKTRPKSWCGSRMLRIDGELFVDSHAVAKLMREGRLKERIRDLEGV